MRLIALALIGLCACSPERGFLIAATHHGGADKDASFDEGLGVRGAGIAATVGPVEVSSSAYRQSIPDGGLGVSVAIAPAEPTIDGGWITARPIGQINWYPEEPTEALEKTGGLFPSFGISLRSDLTEQIGVFCNLYPTAGRIDGESYTFDRLTVCGLSMEF